MADNKSVLTDLTWQRAAQMALDVQGACNLSGVARSFALVMVFLRAEGLDTPSANTHPIARLFAEQIAHLTGASYDGSALGYSRAYDACTALAAGHVGQGVCDARA